MTLNDLAKKHKIPYSSLARWVEQGLIEPQGRTGRSGSVVVLNKKNIREIENLVGLQKGGLSMQRARYLMEDLRAAGYNPLSKGVFVVIGMRHAWELRISGDQKAARESVRAHKGQEGMEKH